MARSGQGSITKSDNGYARKLLVEADWSYRHVARVARQIQGRHEGLSNAIIDRARDTQVRLCQRYRKLTARDGGRAAAQSTLARR